jgi:hypothetical protein
VGNIQKKCKEKNDIIKAHNDILHPLQNLKTKKDHPEDHTQDSEETLIKDSTEDVKVPL